MGARRLMMVTILTAGQICTCVGGIVGSGASSLEWSGVTLQLKRGGQNKVILGDVSGSARAGRLLAIMGPSGSGKTSLLQAVAGQVKWSPGLRLEGCLEVDGLMVEDGQLEGPVGYVKQDDTFFSQMTVRETLMFAARLRLPRTVPLAEKQARVADVMARLGLTKVAETIVGDEKVRGISGGERKRLSIACELLSDPPVLFLDEPTSGLDSYQAERLIDLLKGMVAEGRTIVTVIHQPSSRMFRQFDDLLLLSEGRLMYHGPAAAAVDAFRGQGFVPPVETSPAEYLLAHVSLDDEDTERRTASQARLDLLAAGAQAAADLHRQRREQANAAAAKAAPKLRGLRTTKDGDSSSAGLGQTRDRRTAAWPQASLRDQYQLLFSRAFREVKRAKYVNTIKVTQQVMTALVYGGIYSFRHDQRSIQDRFGLLSLVTIGAANLGIASTIRTFPKEKTIVQRERAKRTYGVLPYLLSKVVAEVPVTAALTGLFGGLLYPLVGLQRRARKFLRFLLVVTLQSFASSAIGMLIGATAPSSDAALALFPPVVVLMVVFNGLNKLEANTPKALRVIPRVSPVRWAFEGLCVNEFRGLEFDCKVGRFGPCLATGEEALAQISMEDSSLHRAIGAQARILGATYLATLAVLTLQKPTFLKMAAPGGDSRESPSI